MSREQREIVNRAKEVGEKYDLEIRSLKGEKRQEAIQLFLSTLGSLRMRYDELREGGNHDE